MPGWRYVRTPDWADEILGLRAGWQAHCEHRALALFACHCHIPAHHARELARNGKAKAGAAEALRGRSIGLSKLFEQLGLLLRRHADAAVGHGQLDPVATVADPARSKLDLALLGELAGIAQQVE